MEIPEELYDEHIRAAKAHQAAGKAYDEGWMCFGALGNARLWSKCRRATIRACALTEALNQTPAHDRVAAKHARIAWQQAHLAIATRSINEIRTALRLTAQAHQAAMAAHRQSGK